MRLLIIEDDLNFGRTVKSCIETAAYAVDIILFDEGTIEHVEVNSSEYDLLIMDLVATNDVVRLCADLRELNISIPILAITCACGTRKKIRILDAGADDCITMPFSPAEFMARIRVLLRRPEVMVPITIKSKNLAMDLSSRTVLHEGKEIGLTSKEFGILEYLLRNCGRVISREDLTSHVWDFDYDGMSNVVDVHVNSLRKKLSQGRLHGIIETVRGTGYKISPST